MPDRNQQRREKPVVAQEGDEFRAAMRERNPLQARPHGPAARRVRDTGRTMNSRIHRAARPRDPYFWPGSSTSTPAPHEPTPACRRNADDAQEGGQPEADRGTTCNCDQHGIRTQEAGSPAEQNFGEDKQKPHGGAARRRSAGACYSCPSAIASLTTRIWQSRSADKPDGSIVRRIADRSVRGDGRAFLHAVPNASGGVLSSRHSG